MTIEVYQKLTKSKMCLTSEMRTCFIGVPYVKKIPKHDLDLHPTLQVYVPPCLDSDQEDDDQHLKRLKTQVRKNLIDDPNNVMVYQSVFKPIEDPSLLEKINEHRYLF